MATTQGAAIVWGVGTTGIGGYAAAANATHAFTSEDFSYEADTAEIKNGYGNVITQYFYNYRKVLSLKCFPAGSGASATSVPVAGETVTVTAASDALIAGDYVATSVSRARSGESHVEFDIELTKYDYVTPTT